MTATLHPSALAYLERLRLAASGLPPERSTDLVGDITEHLAVALPADASEADARGVLDRLGSPEQLVAEASADLRPAAEHAVRPDNLRWHWAGYALLFIWPALLFFPPLALVAWLVGVGILLASPRWSALDKLIGFVASLLPLTVLALGLVAWSGTECVAVDGVTTCKGNLDGPLPQALSIAVVVAHAALAVYALFRLARRLRH